ncbi:MAG: 30S ribosomal protein S26e [Candidatus Bathyarchaeia archaeon]
MPQKRKSRGRSKGGKGRSGKVQCSQCGSLVPRDKAKRVTTYKSLVDSGIARELQSQGAIFSRVRSSRWFCVSCSIHRGIRKVRSKVSRKSR